jgi:hypothetical protein
LRLVHKHNPWGGIVINHQFTNQNYTITFVWMHNETNAGAEEGMHLQAFTGADFGDMTSAGPNVWQEFTATFGGRAAGRGLQICLLYPRTVGSHLYVDNIVIRNAAGEVVFENDFEAPFNTIDPGIDYPQNIAVVQGFTVREWSGDELSTVPKP